MELADIDADLLRLKRTVLAERLGSFTAELDSETQKKKARAKLDLMNRGVGSSSILMSTLCAIDRDAHADAEKAAIEYNRAIEEISLIERKVSVQARPWWKKLLRCRSR